MEILEDNENFLLNRKEVKVVVEANSTPTYDEATNIIAKQFGGSPDTIVIRQVKGRFGRNTFLIEAFVYKTKEDKDKFELKGKKVKEKPGQTEQQIQPEQKAKEAKEKESKTKQIPEKQEEKPKEEAKEAKQK